MSSVLRRLNRPGQKGRPQWIAHDGHGARLRRLRQLTQDLVAPAELAERIDRHVSRQPPAVDRDRMRLIVLNMGRELAAQAQVSFEDALERIVQKLEAEGATPEAIAS